MTIKLPKLKFGLIAGAALFANSIHGQDYLKFQDSTKVDGAGLWGVLSSSASKINITYGAGASINFARYDTATMNRILTPVTVASNNDILPGENITDHKHIRIENDFYLTFSTTDTKSLYLVRFDSTGQRQGNKVIVTESSHATNDPVLLAVNDTIHVMWGKSGFTHYYARYTRNLTFIDSASFTSTGSPWPQLVGGLYHNGKIQLFGGDETQNHLTTYYWSSNWKQQNPWTKRIIQSDGNRWWYFATGFAWDNDNQRWYIGYHEFIPGEKDKETVYIGAWDANFTTLETQAISAKGFTRPHFALIGNNLFVAYDAVGQGVFIKKYKVKQSTTSTPSLLKKNTIAISANPNPFKENTLLSVDSPSDSDYSLAVYNMEGAKVADLFIGKSTGDKSLINWEASDLPSGTYFVKLSSNGQEVVKKVTIIK